MDREQCGSGRFGYEPRSPSDRHGEEPITYLELRAHSDPGPFWGHDEALSDDFADWQPRGMTRRTFERCLRWAELGGDDEEGARLVRLLRGELPDVQVEMR
ncbi:hypothetical protein [Nocardioides nanhaiensis]|uniref:Uncharacterized protein n=1 Tax=Nocardioides nanhaiensis TaxID=1476871 RepID=A0ABP8W3D8_9ACTN